MRSKKSVDELRTLADVRGFFADDLERTRENFVWLYQQVANAHSRLQAKVEAEWLPYILTELEDWDDDARSVEVVDEDSGADRFFFQTSPLYAMVRTLVLEESGEGEALGLLRALAGAPCLAAITIVHYDGGFDASPSPDELVDALRSFERREAPWRPTQLTLFINGFSDVHAKAIAGLSLFQNVEWLDVLTRDLTSEGIMAIASSKHFSRLRHFLLASSASDLHHRDARGSRRHTTFLSPRDAFQLCEVLPQLEMLVSIGRGTTLEDIASARRPIDRSAYQAGRSTRERFERAIKPYRTQTYPFDGETSKATFALLDAKRFADAALQPGEVSPAFDDREDWVPAYLLACLEHEGGIEGAFNTAGELVAPLRLRSFCAPEYRREMVKAHPAYEGQFVAQSIFAEAGLVLVEDDQGLVLQPDAQRPKSSHLMDVFHALRESEARFGGIYAEYLCTFETQIIGRVSGEKMRAVLAWEEHEHRFDAAGNLPAGTSQGFRMNGDIHPFRICAEALGFELRADESDEYRLWLTRPAR
ncbi:MAG: hypothetical protein AAGE52_12845 [Myxococcota bacterium]